MTLLARHYRTLQPIAVDADAGRLTPLRRADADPALPLLCPGWFDPQVNGALGVSFNDAALDLAQVERVVRQCRRHGITQLLPTLITASREALAHGFRTLTAARRADPMLAGAIPGYHLEGPYLSAEDGPRGAHPRAHVRPPDWGEFQQLQTHADGLIRLVTLAPEVPGAVPFIERLVAAGVRVAIGHTAATGEQIHAAVAAGATLSTHLGNGCHAMQPRHGGTLGEQLAADELWASFIPDGDHLPASFLKCLLRIKGPQRLLLTCDASPLAGLPAGRYPLWGGELEVLPSGKVVVPGTPYLAGSGHFTDHCVRTLAALGLLPVDAVIDLATRQPRRLLGVEPTPEALLLNDRLEVARVVSLRPEAMPVLLEGRP